VGDVVLYERLRMLAAYREELSQFQSAAATFDLYREDLLLRRAVERSLHVATEICLDIGRRIAAFEGFRYPENNRDVFYVLSEEAILSKELLEVMLDLAGFRNFIVHQYAELDDFRVYEIIHENLDDFDDFAAAIAEYLQRDEPDEKDS